MRLSYYHFFYATNCYNKAIEINAEDCYIADGLRDRSVKPGEAL